jgi:hypothetical protein
VHVPFEAQHGKSCPAQSAFDVHCTQLVPLHRGVDPLHPEQLDPQWVSTLHLAHVSELSQ